LLLQALVAEGTFYSDVELTEQEMERMVMEASRADFLEEEKHRHYSSWNEETSTSAGAEPSSSGTSKLLILGLLDVVSFLVMFRKKLLLCFSSN
jgi:hypothetical protein